ncbi:hypothetical protein DFH06DRAFT_1243798 [Mycena polygramma]|nr:hypothetical protein DFH06DRAFT_1243798 [Mycena polygramma]
MHSQHVTGANLFTSSLLPTPAQAAQLMALLRSNSLPSEPSHLEMIKTAGPVHLVQYDAEIARLNEVIRRVKSERSSLLRYIDRCHSVSSPIRRLPAEILAEIFAFCSPKPGSFYHPEKSIPSDGAERLAQTHLLRLSQVCISWYRTVMGTPQLWATVHAVFGPNGVGSKRAVSLSRSLALSAACPLDIHCVASPAHNVLGLQMLVPHSARWRSLDLYLNQDTPECLANVKGNLPILQNLAVGLYNAHIGDTFETAPRLTDVTLSLEGEKPPQLPWRQLHSVTFYYSSLETCDISDVLAIMRHCSSECVFTVYNLGLYLPSPDLLPCTVELQTLNLFLENSGEDDQQQIFGEILAKLTLLLRQLAISYSGTEPLSWPTDHFLAFVSRSLFCQTLANLYLHNVAITEDELVGCLSEMQALSKLYIEDLVSWDEFEDHTVITDSLLLRLVWVADPSCLVPSLTTFGFTSLFTFDDHTFLDFVTSRLISGRSHDGPFTIETLATPGSVDCDFGAVAVASMSNLVERGQLRWSRITEEDIQLKWA